MDPLNFIGRPGCLTRRIVVCFAAGLGALSWSSGGALGSGPVFDRAAALTFLDAQWSKYFDMPAPAAQNWESGFVPGGLWAMVEAEDAGLVDRGGAYLDNARRWSEALVPGYPTPPATYVPNDHDVGFVYPLAFKPGVTRLAGSISSDRYANLLEGAADQMAARFNGDYGAVNSWNFYPQGTEPIIIDGMVTLQLLEWSALNGGPAEHMEHALSHAAAVIEHQLRVPTAYGSQTGRYAVHVMDMAPVAQGGAAEPGTFFFQAATPESPWARGQAWGILGFAQLFESSLGFTDEATRATLLAASQDMADYFLEQTADRAVPVWDFSIITDPSDPAYDASRDLRDSSAGAIAASGLLRLARISDDPNDRLRYHHAAERLLAELAANHFNLGAASDDPVILNDVVGYFAGGGIGPRTFADHYFTEATLDFAALLPGDVDLDGRVDQADLDAVLTNWGQRGDGNTPSSLTRVDGDLSGDGSVEQADLDAVLRNWGGDAAPDFRGVVVPEPAAVGLGFGSGLLVLRRRRRGA